MREPWVIKVDVKKDDTFKFSPTGSVSTCCPHCGFLVKFELNNSTGDNTITPLLSYEYCDTTNSIKNR